MFILLVFSSTALSVSISPRISFPFLFLFLFVVVVAVVVPHLPPPKKEKEKGGLLPVRGLNIPKADSRGAASPAPGPHILFFGKSAVCTTAPKGWAVAAAN